MSTIEPSVRKPAAWVFLVLIAATLLSAGISISMIEAPQMLSEHEGAGLVQFFLAVGAVYLGIPVTWLLGLSVIATYPRTSLPIVSRGSLIATAIWTVCLAAPYVAALLR